MNCAECKEILVAYLEGLLAEPQKQAVTEHLKDCRSCQAEVKQLTSLQERLVSNGRTVAQSDLENDVMNQIVREQNVRLKAARKATAGLKLRRLIMRSSITKMAAAAVIIIAVLIGMYFVGNPFAATVTFAKVIEPILNARTVILDLIIGAEETNPLMHEIVVGSRIRRTISNLPNMTQIIDLESGKMLALDTEGKTAFYVDIQGSLQERTRSYIESVRQVIIKLQDNYEELGEQEIDGQKAIGFVARGPNEEVKVWADPKTALPIRIELRIGQMFAILKNFQFDVPIEDSLISMDVPSGYTLKQTKFDLSGATEQDFVESLRIWAEVLQGGTFPEAIGTENAMKQMPLFTERLAQLNLPEDEATEKAMRFARGMLFHQILDSQGKWHYAGQGVKLGDASKAIFWYQPKGSETYRVIYGDLSVKDVTPENLPK
jgi:hypothetical protein